MSLICSVNVGIFFDCLYDSACQEGPSGMELVRQYCDIGVGGG
jgi:hypothetical protein